MRKYKITFNPIDQTLPPIGPITVLAAWQDEAVDMAIEILKTDYPSRSQDPKDYNPHPGVSWSEVTD